MQGFCFCFSGQTMLSRTIGILLLNVGVIRTARPVIESVVRSVVRSTERSLVRSIVPWLRFLGLIVLLPLILPLLLRLLRLLLITPVRIQRSNILYNGVLMISRMLMRSAVQAKVRRRINTWYILSSSSSSSCSACCSSVDGLMTDVH